MTNTAKGTYIIPMLINRSLKNGTASMLVRFGVLISVIQNGGNGRNGDFRC